MPKFIPSLELNEQFFHEVLAPLLTEKFPKLLYSAARLGDGSDVLGYDTAMSMDHDWGIRMQLFVSEADFEAVGTAVSYTLMHHLPAQYKGHPVHFAPPNEEGTQLAEEYESGPVNHRIKVITLQKFFKNQLNIDPYQALDAIDWLTMPQQLLLTVTQGRVFDDKPNMLAPIREKFAYFPHDVWLYLMAMQWGRVSEEEHFVGRTGIVGDELGSALLASHLVHDLMCLCFLMEKQYAPYPKWFGTAFLALESASKIQPILNHILAATDWETRENWLVKGYSVVAEMHNRLGVTESLSTETIPFFERPFQVLYAGRFQSALMKQIKDPQLLAIDSQVGSIDQMSNNTQLKSYPHLHPRLRVLYDGSGER